MSEQIKRTGRVTIPTNLDVVPETIEILKILLYVILISKGR